MKGETVNIDIDMDKRCSKCKKPGACQNGLCLKCTTDRMLAKIKAEAESRS